jgi:4-oxalocrotonate tautomerase
MPTITVSGPVADVERKRKLAEGLTKAAAEAYGMPREAIIVIIYRGSWMTGMTGGLR